MEQKNITAGLTSGTGVDTSDLVGHKKRNGDTAQAYNSDSANEWFYKKQEAELNHRYAIDAWQRENEYNTPENIANRLRQAGINPRVAFGNGSGVGGTIEAGKASGSYGTSDVTQNTQNAQRGLAMVSGLINDGATVAQSIGGILNLRAETRNTNARTAGLNIENRYKETQILQDLESKKADILEKKSNANLNDRQREHYDAQERWIDQQIDASKQNVAESQQNVRKSQQDIRESQKRMGKLDSEIRLNDALTDLNNNRVETEKMDQALKEAQKGHLEALKKQVDNEIELTSAKIGLTKEQTREVKNRIARNWAEFGITAAKMTSQEVRKWMFGWIPFTSDEDPVQMPSYPSNGFSVSTSK